MNCNICGSLANSLYVSGNLASITSICEVIGQRTQVFFCGSCGHLQTKEIEDIEKYYDKEYKFLATSEEEDQLYKVEASGKIFRFDHQASTLLRKVKMPPNPKILDLGCSKGSTLKRVLSERSDVIPHLFDVTDGYVNFWEKFVPEDRYAVYNIPASWRNYFDLVVSFFVLEHVDDPRKVLAEVRGLLKPEGIFYGIVPNVYANWADFLVVDHVNHFSRDSIEYFLSAGGFSVIEIDDTAHESAFVFIAKKKENSVCRKPKEDALRKITAEVREIADFWRGMAEKIREFENVGAVDKKAAIYGAGFYGTFIASNLEKPDSLVCFIDRNPYRQGQSLFGKPIIDPRALPENVEIVYVGLNPRLARNEISKIGEEWKDRQLEFFYL